MDGGWWMVGGEVRGGPPEEVTTVGGFPRTEPGAQP